MAIIQLQLHYIYDNYPLKNLIQDVQDSPNLIQDNDYSSHVMSTGTIHTKFRRTFFTLTHDPFTGLPSAQKNPPTSPTNIAHKNHI